MLPYRSFIVILFFSFVFVGCKFDSNENVGNDLQGDKFYSIKRDKENKVISTYLRDKNLESDRKIEYFYDSDDSLKMKIVQLIYNDSVNSDTVFYSYLNTDSLKKQIEIEYSNGKILRKRIESNIYEDEQLMRRDFLMTFFNEKNESFDTTKLSSVHSYANGKKMKHVIYSDKYTVSHNFIYENDLLKEKVLINEINGDTLNVLTYQYKDNSTVKVTDTDYKMKTILTSKYNAERILVDAFWEKSDIESDTIKVQILDSVNTIIYYWNKDYYPSFTLDFNN